MDIILTYIPNQLHIAMLPLATVDCTCMRENYSWGLWATINVSKCIITGRILRIVAIELSPAVLQPLASSKISASKLGSL